VAAAEGVMAEHEREALLRELDVAAERHRERMRQARLPKQAPKPAMPVVSVECAQRVHRQSGERLVERQESAAERGRRVFAEMRQAAQQENERRCAAQRALDFWMEEKLFAEEAERRFRRELDPCNMGLYGAEPFHRGRGED
jgi:hypothetical protein